ncbi:hypothetical protein Javan576_0061 [Streptococcus phage Javan576]|nr:hypothetical protein Javan576_0061 [Streptococcus phage Javan576]
MKGGDNMNVINTILTHPLVLVAVPVLLTWLLDKFDDKD